MPMIPAIIKDDYGQKWINKSKKFFKPFFLTPDQDEDDGILTLAAQIGATAYSPVTVTQEGPEDIYAFIMASDRFRAFGDHACLVDIIDDATGKHLMNRPVHANTIFGTPEFPAVLSEYYYLNEHRAFTIQLQNLVNAQNNIRAMFDSKRIYTTAAESGYVNERVAELMERSVGTMPYFLTPDTDVELAAGATQTFRFPSDADSYIEIFKMAFVGYDTDDPAPNLNGRLEFTIRDAETKRDLHTGTLTDETAMGTGETPFVFPESLLILPRQQTEIVITNQTPAAHAAEFYITMIGRKIYVTTT